MKDVVPLIRNGEPTAVRLARSAGRILSEVISDAVNLLNLSVVIVGGQVAQAEELLLASIREQVYQRSPPLATRSLQIVPSRLGDQAGVIGLALLCADEIFSPAAIGLRLSATTDPQSR